MSGSRLEQSQNMTKTSNPRTSNSNNNALHAGQYVPYNYSQLFSGEMAKQAMLMNFPQNLFTANFSNNGQLVVKDESMMMSPLQLQSRKSQDQNEAMAQMNASQLKTASNMPVRNQQRRRSSVVQQQHLSRLLQNSSGYYPQKESIL